MARRITTPGQPPGRRGKPLMPCTPRRARQLINTGRRRQTPLPAIHHPAQRPLRRRRNHRHPTRRAADHPKNAAHGVALVALLQNEERTLYEEEIQHRTDISTEAPGTQEPPATPAEGAVVPRPPVSTTGAERTTSFRRRSRASSPTRSTASAASPHAPGAATVILQDTKFDTQKVLNPGIQGKEYQQGPLYQLAAGHRREVQRRPDRAGSSAGAWSTARSSPCCSTAPCVAARSPPSAGPTSLSTVRRSKSDPTGGRADVRRLVGSCAAAVRSLHAAVSPEPGDAVVGLSVDQINRRFAAACAAAGLEGRRTSARRPRRSRRRAHRARGFHPRHPARRRVEGPRHGGPLRREHQHARRSRQ